MTTPPHPPLVNFRCVDVTDPHLFGSEELLERACVESMREPLVGRERARQEVVEEQRGEADFLGRRGERGARDPRERLARGGRRR